jgi:pyruvate/2-oxoglutarate dehydrogenase complex dihydrolipoamide acyltransferase (E2) component
VGSITKKPGVKGSAIEVREYLKLTVLIDHDVMDGMPAARFLLRLGRLLEGAHGLSDVGSPDDEGEAE